MKHTISHFTFPLLPLVTLLTTSSIHADQPGARAADASAPVAAANTPAAVVFGDVDGDGLDDAFVVGPRGDAHLLMNFGGGRFEDITQASGLGALRGATCALFADLDGDGKMDLFVGSSDTRVWKNRGDSTFAPMLSESTGSSGIDHDLVDFSARAVDRDKDGRLDLEIKTEAGELVYRNLGRGRFERFALPLASSAQRFSDPSFVAPADVGADTTRSKPEERRLARWISGRTSFAISPASVAPGGSAAPHSSLQYCSPDIVDEGGGPCLTASSVPALGKLYPMSTDLNVSGSGYVGIGTTTPVTKLTVVAATGGATIISALSGNSFFNAGIDVGRLTGEFSIGVARAANNWVTGSLEGDTALRVNDGAKKIHLACGGGGAVPTMSVAWDGVGIGTITATPGFLLDVAGNVRCVSLTQTSTRELKQDIAPIHGALDSILKLQGVTYSWNEKAPESVQGHCDIGFIADEVDAVLPAIVAKDENGKAIGLDYGKIAPVAVEAIKELKAENDALKARLDKLEAVLAASGK